MTTFKTGNPVPSTAVRDLYDNSENFDAAMNGLSLTWIDRLGRERVSVEALRNAIDVITSFTYRGEWAPGVAYKAKDVVRFDNIEYITMRDHVSSSSFEADRAAGFWTIYQGISRAELAASGGAALIGWLSSGPGAIVRSVQSKLDDSVNLKDYGAILDGVADDTEAFKKAAATGRHVRWRGRCRISDTISWTVDGQIFSGDGKDGQSVLLNNTNDKQIFSSSIGTGAVFKRRGGLENFSIEGNSASVGGLDLRGILNDGLTGDADKSCAIRNIRITKVGAGPALEVNSWCNNIYGIELWDNYQGFKIGAEANSFGSYGLYITGCTKEAIILPQGSGQPSVINFYNTTAQYSGGDEYMIDIRDGYAIKFHGLYLEASYAPLGPINLGGQAAMVGFDNVMHNLVDGVANVPIITTNIKHCQVRDIVNLGGAMASFVKITGALPFTHIEEMHVAAGSMVTSVDDQSTRRATIVIDWNNARLPPNRTYGLVSQNLTEWRRTETDAIVAFMRGDGRLFFGPDATVPSLSRTGGTMSMLYDAGIGTFRAPQFGLGATGGPIWVSGTGSPEGAVSAPPGSIYSRISGGDMTTLYIKVSGTGNTGWLAK